MAISTSKIEPLFTSIKGTVKNSMKGISSLSTGASNEQAFAKQSYER